MKICIIAIWIVIIFGITGCADNVSLSQNYEDTDAGSLTFSSEELLTDPGSGEKTSDKSVSGEMGSELTEDIQTPNALIPAVMIDGTVYYLSQGSPIPDQEIEPDQTDTGYVESEVSLGTFPQKDGESNYAPAGTPYVKYGNGYALKTDEYGWSYFLTWKERLEEQGQ
ncbi:MAG TPA: hypothetical protein DCZ91_12950 [Lachnospiraceae bacterium]|nr:hypothetical protein [Lachnospiraceae bacterium]